MSKIQTEQKQKNWGAPALTHGPASCETGFTGCRGEARQRHNHVAVEEAPDGDARRRTEAFHELWKHRGYVNRLDASSPFPRISKELLDDRLRAEALQEAKVLRRAQQIQLSLVSGSSLS